MTTARSRRSWLVHSGVVGLALVTSILAIPLTAVVVLLGTDSGTYLCGSEVSEGTMIAPSSWRGQVYCTDGPYGPRARDWLLVVIMLTAPAAAIVVLVRWFRDRGRRGLALGLLLVLVLPATALLAVGALPAGCTDGQRERYGDAGCERSIELRNG